jgi:hypothetical protein
MNHATYYPLSTILSFKKAHREKRVEHIENRPILSLPSINLASLFSQDYFEVQKVTQRIIGIWESISS